MRAGPGSVVGLVGSGLHLVKRGLGALGGCLATPASAPATTAASLGKGWWRQGGGLSGDPPVGGRPVRRERTSFIQWRQVVSFTVVPVVQIHARDSYRCVKKN